MKKLTKNDKLVKAVKELLDNTPIRHDLNGVARTKDFTCPIIRKLGRLINWDKK